MDVGDEDPGQLRGVESRRLDPGIERGEGRGRSGLDQGQLVRSGQQVGVDDAVPPLKPEIDGPDTLVDPCRRAPGKRSWRRLPHTKPPATRWMPNVRTEYGITHVPAGATICQRSEPCTSFRPTKRRSPFGRMPSRSCACARARSSASRRRRSRSSASSPPDAGWTDAVDVRAINAVTGPVFIEGVMPGDAVSVEVLAIEPRDWAWNAAIPGFGLLDGLLPGAHAGATAHS